MKEKVQKWMEKAEKEAITAEINLQNKQYEAAAFYSQQSAEKALKAVQIYKLSRFDKIHDLAALAGTVGAPDEVVACCVELNPYYTIARYPDVEEVVTKKTSEGLIRASKKVVEWAKKILMQ
ncbi:HEPN domain-containing protein [Candidatus Woesearchaeota archaeon]|nr:HEPN domain-containing protein [Candidatus Woesearchaeota archaeon]